MLDPQNSWSIFDIEIVSLCLLVYDMTSIKSQNYITRSTELYSLMKKFHLKYCDFSWKNMSINFFLYGHEHWWKVTCYVCVAKQTFGSYCLYWTNETMTMINSITNWMLLKGPSEKDIWQGVDRKTKSVFEKIISIKK